MLIDITSDSGWNNNTHEVLVRTRDSPKFNFVVLCPNTAFLFAEDAVTSVVYVRDFSLPNFGRRVPI